MTDQEIQITIAEATGVAPAVLGYWCVSPEGNASCFSAETEKECQDWLNSLPEGSWPKKYTVKAYLKYPDYLNDSNAMRNALLTLPDNLVPKYQYELCRVRNDKCMPVCRCCMAEPREQAVAFVRVIGKWKEEAK